MFKRKKNSDIAARPEVVRKREKDIMDQKSNAFKAFATRSPFLFTLVFFVVSFCLVLVDLFVLPPLWGDQVVQSLLNASR